MRYVLVWSGVSTIYRRGRRARGEIKYRHKGLALISLVEGPPEQDLGLLVWNRNTLV